MLTIKQAAQQANCHRDTIVRAINTQKLPACKVQGKFKPEWRIKESDFDAWMQQAGTNVVTLPTETYVQMQQSLQATTALATALMGEIRTMQSTYMQHAEAASAQQAEMLDMIRDLKSTMQEMQQAQHEAVEAKKKPLFRRFVEWVRG